MAVEIALCSFHQNVSHVYYQRTLLNTQLVLWCRLRTLVRVLVLHVLKRLLDLHVLLYGGLVFAHVHCTCVNTPPK